MKLPSFIRLPNNRKFKFSPRHYDPVKDDIDQRVSGIKNSKKYFSRSKKTEQLGGSKLQIIIAFFLSFFIFGWLYAGNKIFIFVPLFCLWFLYKNFIKKK